MSKKQKTSEFFKNSGVLVLRRLNTTKAKVDVGIRWVVPGAKSSLDVANAGIPRTAAQHSGIT